MGTVLNEKVAASKPYTQLNRGIGLGTGISAQEAARPAPPPRPK